MNKHQQTKWKSVASLASAALLTFASAASAQLTVTGNSQLGTVPFTPAWTPATSHLLAGVAPTTAAGTFDQWGTGGNAANLTTVGIPIEVRNYGGAGNLEVCGAGAGSSLIYKLPAATYGQNITNITVYGGWQDAGRDAQDYTVYYSTVDDPQNFKRLTSVHYNPSNPSAKASATRVVINDLSGGLIANNVYALEFDFTSPGAENNAAGYMAITVQGTEASGPTELPPGIRYSYSTQSPALGTAPSWTIETDSLIAGQAPSVVGGGNFASFNIGSPGVSALTDGTFGIVDSGATYATCGSGDCGSSVTYTLTNSANGSDITNIVVYSGWSSNGREGQFYKVSYSTVSAPNVFIPLAHVVYNPPGNNATSTSDRVAIYDSTGGALAKNVQSLKFDFSEQDGYLDNGASLYAEIIVEGTNSAPPTAPPSPYLIDDTLPATAETVVGDSITFVAGFSNAPAATYQWQFVKEGVTNDIPGATSATLTINNLTTNDTGFYQLKAVNATNGLGVAYSSACPLTVNSTPVAVNGIIALYANQTGLGALSTQTNFYPTWSTPAASLITGSTWEDGTMVMGGGSYDLGNCNWNPDILTDGSFGFINYYPGVGGCASLVSMGNTAGQDVTYILPGAGAAAGYDLTNIVVYGGWGDLGRDAQHYEVLYSTVLAPDTFLHLAFVDYNPIIPEQKQSATRSQLIPVGTALARNVAKVKFLYFQQGNAPEHDWVGVSEIVVNGTPSLNIPVITQEITPLTAADVVGSKVTITAAFSSDLPLTYQWQKNGTNIPGATSPTLTLNNLQLSDTATNGGYSLVASNSVGNVSSRGCALTVNPAPTPVANIVTSVAYQTSDSGTFGPTWDTSELSASLLYGKVADGYGAGNYNGPDPDVKYHNLAGGIPVLTDGNYGQIVTGGAAPAFATCGNGGGAGQFVSYLLDTNASPLGYDLSKIAIAGGWNDGGRDAQYYVIYYSTVSAPGVFTKLTYSSNNPDLQVHANRSVVRTTFTPVTGMLVSNVAAVLIDFTIPGNENGYCGYSEVSVFGSASTTQPTGNILTAENQSTDTPSWSLETPNLIAGQLPSGYSGNFTVEAGGGSFAVLTDGTTGPVGGIANFATCGNAGGNFVIYTCPNHSWNLTNIVVYSGWGNYDRDGQFYDISYTTPEDPTTWILLQSLEYNPVPSAGAEKNPTVNRVSITGRNGQVLAANVAQIKFNFDTQSGRDNGYSGYSEIVLQGSVNAGASTLPVVTLEHQQDATTWTVEPGSLIAGQLPSNVVGGTNGFTGEGCNVTNLTDGKLGFGFAYGASCGSEPSLAHVVTFSNTNGWNLTNIVVYTLWQDYGREGQFYNISYSTMAEPTKFLPLANVAYNPYIATGIKSANRVSIAPPFGQTMLASNVAALKFDFTPQGSLDFSWSGYTEIVVLGASLASVSPTPPSLGVPRYSGGANGNLILTGTGGTPSAGYVWLSTTNVALPLSQWATNNTGTLDAAGAFSNALPVSATQPAQFFKLKMQ